MKKTFPQQMRTEKKYRDTALPIELKNKGPVNIQVWDDDETSSEYLGGFELDIADIISSKDRQKRMLTGPIKKKKKMETKL